MIYHAPMRLSHALTCLLVALLWLPGAGCDDDPPADGDADADGDGDGDGDSDADGDVESDGDADGDSAPLHIDEQPGCDNLCPLYCAFPFPSDRFLEIDESTVTGYRLEPTAEMLPDSVDAEEFDFSPYQRLDGMSPATQVMTLFDRPADLSEAASSQDIGRSLEPDSPTVILDLETGERVAHWAENDARATSEAETVLYLRLASRLEENRSYAVALRGLRDAEGDPLEPSPAFRALRDGLPTDSDELEARRDGFEETFEALEAAGLDRSELLLAWRFHTASGEAIRSDLLHARADALERLGPSGIGCDVTEVVEGDDGLILRRIRGTYTVPSYMQSPAPPTRYNRGDDGMPEYVEDVEVPFSMIIPASLVEGEGDPEAGPLVVFGHGLMGDAASYMRMEALRRIAYETGSVLVGTDWAGMSSADVLAVGDALAAPSNFVNVTERLQQGMINQIALGRTFLGACADLPEFYQDDVNLVDTSALYFTGVSQGGIYGGTLLTISPDIQRGVLLVNGVVFPFMMERSIDFVPYFPVFEMSFPNRLDQALLLPMAQHLWDAAEPSGYISHMIEGLPGIGPKQVLSVAAHNDAQVPNLSTDQAMRMIGVPVIEGSTREPWGFEVVAAPHAGSGYITIDMGDRPVPEGNVAPEVNDDGHSLVGQREPALTIIRTFLLTGEITVPCDGTCDPD